MKHLRTWYVLADGGRARLVRRREANSGFETQRESGFETARELESATLHRRARDLGTDKPGRTQESAAAASHSVQPRADLHLAAKLSFVEEVAAMLEDAGAHREFDRLVLVAPAPILSALRNALTAKTRSCVAAELQKDLTKVPDADLTPHFAGLRPA